MLLTNLGAAGWELPPVVRRGETVCPGREAGRRASAAGHGPKRYWTSNARPGLAQGHGCPQRTLTDARDGEGQSPSARALGQTGEPREPEAGGRTSGG